MVVLAQSGTAVEWLGPPTVSLSEETSSGINVQLTVAYNINGVILYQAVQEAETVIICIHVCNKNIFACILWSLCVAMHMPMWLSVSKISGTTAVGNSWTNYHIPQIEPVVMLISFQRWGNLSRKVVSSHRRNLASKRMIPCEHENKISLSRF
jgi:hypothetical protein